MDDQTNAPQDMWPDDEPAKPQSMPINQPPVPPVASPIAPQPHQADPLVASVPMPKPKLPRKRAGWVSWVVTIVILAIVALGGGYAVGKYWPNIQSWFKKAPANEVTQTGPVEWQAIQPIQSLGLMKDPSNEANTLGYSSSETPNSLTRYYLVGKFISGPYQDAELILADGTYGQTMGGADGVFRIAKKTDGSLVVIGRQSPDLSGWSEDDLLIDRSKFTIDSSYIIPDLEMPDKIANTADPSQVIYRASASDSPLLAGSAVIKNAIWKKPEQWVEAFENPINNLPIMTDPRPVQLSEVGDSTHANGFYVELADGTFITYLIKPAFMMSGVNSQSDWLGSGIASVIWTDTNTGTTNSDEYSMAHMGGCGVSNYAEVMPDSLASKLVVMGKTDNTEAENIYRLNDSNDQMIKDLYDTYKSYGQAINGKVLTYAQFLAKHPLFFWRDQFGRIIKFTRTDILPAAECGKPVIYLYPEKTTRVSVKVSPVGGFSFTDPDYGTGWDVIAQPDGVLTEIKSQKTYPYLFWEGRGGLYQAPTQGWVIKQAEVSGFLNDKLAQLGLNAKEIADFKEFWLPRMQGAPYYFVGFWGNATMNQIAPLNITPKPDTVVRILMDFKPLQQPIEVVAPTIKTPTRKGFTVIEWGGVIQ